MAEELLLEIEAVQAVYGSDCRVIKEFPPMLNVHIKPRTADDSSQQFVEAVLGIQAGEQYPVDPPTIYIIESKGLDENRQVHLITSLQDKAKELSTCLMLIAICEEAVELLSNMNHPDGNCPLCLYPLVIEDNQNHLSPFMKLMSCFHCFHSECLIRWWKWLQEQNEITASNSLLATYPVPRDFDTRSRISASLISEEADSYVAQRVGNCPVCRKVFHTEDIEHVLDLLVISSSELSLDGTNIIDGEEEILKSEAENIRKQKFESALKIQQENDGIIEPKKIDVLLPGMFLPEPLTRPSVSIKTPSEKKPEDCTRNLSSESTSSNSMDKPSTSKQNSASMRRKTRVHNPRKHFNTQSHIKQWIEKKGTQD